MKAIQILLMLLTVVIAHKKNVGLQYSPLKYPRLNTEMQKW